MGGENVDVQHRIYPRIGEGEQEAFAAALDANVDGIITWSGEPEKIKTLMRRASRSKIPVVCVGSDAPKSGRLALVSVDTLASGAIAADLMGLTLRGIGKVAITMAEVSTMEHAEKLRSFENTLHSFYPGVQMLSPIEDRNIEALAYEKCCKLFLNTLIWAASISPLMLRFQRSCGPRPWSCEQDDDCCHRPVSSVDK